MKPSSIKPQLAMLLGALLAGCGTVSTRTSGDAGPFHGFGHDMEKVSSSSEWLELSGQGSVGNVPFLWPRGALWILDAPLSLVADTLLLPADALRSKADEHNVESEMDLQDGAAKSLQPIHSETNSTSPAPASRR